METPDKYIYSPPFQQTVDDLKKAQEHLAISEAKFAKQYLKTLSVSTWNRLCNNQYEEREKTHSELKEILRGVRARIQRQLKQASGGEFIEHDQYRAIAAAVSECLTKKGENRLIIYAAPTGGGKSRNIAELSKQEAVVTLRAGEPWYTSYYFAGIDVLAAMGENGPFTRSGDVRKEMIKKMRETQAKVLAIDEGNYFGPRSINMLKDILNETEWTVLVCMTPEHFSNMKRYYKEFVQLRRRIHTVFRHQPLSKAEVKLFLDAAGLNGDAEKAALVLAKEANAFGAFDFIQRVTDRLCDNAAAHPTLSDVESAIAVVKKQLDLTGED